jgi:hypothetical protein
MLINILYFKIKVNYDVITGNNLKWIIVFLPTFLAWIFGIASAIFFRTFIKKDALISVIVYVICLLTYELYIIISVAITNQLNTTNAYLLIPSIVFSCLAVIFFIGGYVIFQRAYVKV